MRKTYAALILTVLLGAGAYFSCATPGPLPPLPPPTCDLCPTAHVDGGQTTHDR